MTVLLAIAIPGGALLWMLLEGRHHEKKKNR